MGGWRYTDDADYIGTERVAFPTKKLAKPKKTNGTKKPQREQMAFAGFLERTLPPPKKSTPIVKWLGGKKWMIKLSGQGIYARLCRTGGRYIEPFLGGGAMALYLGLPNMIIADACSHLVRTYLAVRAEPSEVAWQISALATEGVDEATYYKVRESFNAVDGDEIKQAARFIYMNKIGFNGVYRENKKGHFNVPYGDQVYRRSVVKRKTNDRADNLFPSSRTLHNLSEAWATSDLSNSDFRVTIAKARAGDVIFSDPPYVKTYNGYTKDGFTPQDQEDLAEALYDAVARGAVMVSTNSDQPEVRELYSWATVMSTAEARSVSRIASQRKRKACLLAISEGAETILGT
jgi:DNA adenine methylase